MPARTPSSERAYTADELQAIDAAYEAEAPRGAVVRRAEDVRVGEVVGPMVKGPLTITDLVEYRAGVGPGPLGGEPLRLAYRNRKARPAMYAHDPFGVYDIVERRHWDEPYAQSEGLLAATDYSHTRLVWFSHLLTDWMGDGGWLYELRGTTGLGRNYVGDTHRLAAQVTDVVLGERCGAVSLSVTGTNQRGALTCRATAVVLLPAGSSVLADPEEGPSLVGE